MAAASDWGQIAEPVVYRVTTFWTFASYALALLGAGLASVAGWMAVRSLPGAFHRGPPFAAGFFTVVVGFALAQALMAYVCAVYPRRAFVRITPALVEWRGAFGLQALRRDEVVGVRRGSRGSCRLVTTSGRAHALPDTGIMDTDERFTRWLDSLPDRDREGA